MWDLPEGSNPCLLHWQVNSAPLSHQGSPVISFFYHLCLLGGEDNSNPLQYSCLESSMDRGVWWAAVHRVAQSRTWLKWRSMHACLLGPHTAPQLIIIFFKTHFKWSLLWEALWLSGWAACPLLWDPRQPHSTSVINLPDCVSLWDGDIFERRDLILLSFMFLTFRMVLSS